MGTEQPYLLTIMKSIYDKSTGNIIPQDIWNQVSDHSESDILECELKWALGSITTNKASGGDGIPVELFRILKDDVV